MFLLHLVHGSVTIGGKTITRSSPTAPRRLAWGCHRSPRASETWPSVRGAMATFNTTGHCAHVAKANKGEHGGHPVATQGLLETRAFWGMGPVLRGQHQRPGQQAAWPPLALPSTG